MDWISPAQLSFETLLLFFFPHLLCRLECFIPKCEIWLKLWMHGKARGINPLKLLLGEWSLFPPQFILTAGIFFPLGKAWLAGKKTKSPFFLQNCALSVDIFQCLRFCHAGRAFACALFYCNLLCLSTFRDLKAQLTWRWDFFKPTENLHSKCSRKIKTHFYGLDVKL